MATLNQKTAAKENIKKAQAARKNDSAKTGNAQLSTKPKVRQTPHKG